MWAWVAGSVKLTVTGPLMRSTEAIPRALRTIPSHDLRFLLVEVMMGLP
jgi:hypothetical protein